MNGNGRDPHAFRHVKVIPVPSLGVASMRLGFEENPREDRVGRRALRWEVVWRVGVDRWIGL